jgi:hypothetical protein
MGEYIMTIKKLSVFPVNFEFICDSKSNKSGFKHTCTMFVNGVQFTQKSIQYYNRTWESYQYQSILKATFKSYIDFIYYDLLDKFKNDNNYQKMTCKRYQEFRQNLLNTDIFYQALLSKFVDLEFNIFN